MGGGQVDFPDTSIHTQESKCRDTTSLLPRPSAILFLSEQSYRYQRLLSLENGTFVGRTSARHWAIDPLDSISSQKRLPFEPYTLYQIRKDLKVTSSPGLI